MLEKKQATSASELYAGLPSEFKDYMNYVNNLRDEDQPNYQHLRKIFNKLFRRQGFEYDNVFNWTIREFLRLERDAQESLASRGADERREEEITKPMSDAARNVTKIARRKRR